MGKRGWSVVLGVTAAVVVLAAPGPRTDWDLFWWGGDQLRDHGLRAYAESPGLLIGPLPLLYALAAPTGLELLTPALAAGVTVWLVARRDPWWALALFPVLIAAPLWGHLDDVAATWGVWGALTWPAVGGWLIGVGVLCKPWALPVAVIDRRWIIPALVVTVVGWAPFLLAGPGGLATFHVDPQPGSVWAVLHVPVPPGLRLWQLLAMAAVAWRLRADPWRAVLAAFTIRVLLEPGDWSYYLTPLAVFAPRVNPRVTVPAVLAAWALSYTDLGALRVAALLVVLVAVRPSGNGRGASRTSPAPRPRRLSPRR